MGSLSTVVDAIVAFLQQGYAQVNTFPALLIAVFATVLMRQWGQLLILSLGAAILYEIALKVIPMVTDGTSVGELKLPPLLELSFWNKFASLYIGFVIVIAMFFAVKKVVFMRGHGGKAKAH